MRIEIKSKNLSNPRDYKGRQYGEQQAALHAGGDYPLPFKLNREVGHALEPGFYTLSGDSFFTDEHQNLKLKRVVLAPLPAGAK